MTPFSLILPCYNEAASLRALVARVLQCAARRSMQPSDFRLILVDNGSVDETAAVLAEILQERGAEFITPVKVPVNRGYGHGVFQGLKAAPNGIIGWTHADEQCDPEDAFVAWERARAGGENVLVKGTRNRRSLGGWLFSRCFETIAFLLLGRRLHEINAQPKVFPIQLLDRLGEPPLDFAFDLYVLIKALENGFIVEEIPVLFPDRKHGQSRWASTLRSRWRTIWRMVRFMFDYRFG